MFAMFSMPGGTEWLLIGVVALILFGRRLPDVARSMGRSIVEFKKGLKDVKDEIDTPAELPGNQPARLERQAPEVTQSKSS